MPTIQNDLLSIDIATKGAELQRVFHKKFSLDYLWDADPAFWAKHSPVLFPIVGTLKSDTYYFDYKAYTLGRHGFARDKNFVIAKQEESAISLLLESDAETLYHYPFAFRLYIDYTLENDSLKVNYRVENNGKADMLFSIGGHPAFRVPLAKGLTYEDYFLEFSESETAPRWPISTDGLIEKTPVPLLQQTRQLPLTKSLFAKDALVFKHLASDSISLRTSRDSHGLTLHCPGFPYLGIWAAKNADFVCIEPWLGIADSVDASQQLPEKEGIQSIKAGEMFEKGWAVRFF